MTVGTSRPEVPLRVITPADVRASISRARRSLEKAAEEIVWQIEMEAWRTLGYSSWGAMREAEYGGAAFMVPSKSRPEIVARIKQIEIGRSARGGSKHLTDQEIADTVGVSRRQVQDDLNENNEVRSSAQNVAPSPEADDAVIDAEVIEDEDDFVTDQADLDTAQKATDPAPAEPVNAVACPTCHGTGKVSQ